MAKRKINLVLEVVIEIIEWFKTRKDEENGGKNDSKRDSKEK
jgi:hypothetical protein